MRFSDRSIHATKGILFAAVLMANLALSVAASAQPAWQGRFTLPYEVHWNHAVLPAGNYTITMESKYAPAIIRTANGNRSFYTGVPAVVGSEEGGASLLITTRNGQHTVRSLNAPMLGTSFVFQAIPKSEREALAANAQLDTVPVMVTEK